VPLLRHNLSPLCSYTYPELVNLHTEVWFACKSEVKWPDLHLHEELDEVYEHILSANNVVWLVKELRSKSQDITYNYLNLQAKITERLQRIIPLVTVPLSILPNSKFNLI
jgi:hypothetical protein